MKFRICNSRPQATVCLRPHESARSCRAARATFRQIVFHLLIAALTLHSSGCSRTAAPALAGVSDSQGSVNPASVLFRETRIDLGDVPLTLAGNRKQVTFDVTNTTGRSVQFLPFVITCGCSEANAIPERLGPGETGQVVVDLKTDQPGERDVQVFASTDLADAAPVELRVTWTTVPPVQLTPSRLEFGTIPTGSTETRTVQLTASRFSDVALDSISVHTDQNNGLHARLVAPDTLEVQVTAGTVAREFRGVVRLKSDHTTLPNQELPVCWTVRPLVTCEPPSQFIEVVAAGEPISATFTVRSHATPLRETTIAARESDAALRQVEFEFINPKVARVTVNAVAPRTAGAFAMTFPLPLTSDGVTTLEAAITGIVRDDDG
jgi:hypothetical protein